MIVRAINRAVTPLLTSPVDAPAGVRGLFGRIQVLELTSTELRESFGILLAPLDVETAEELFAALKRHRDRPTAARIDEDRLIRLIDGGQVSLPCFVGYVDVPGVGLLPFLSDGAPGKWSLFLEEDGGMTLVECRHAQLCVTADRQLAQPALATVTPISKAREALVGSLSSARKILAGTSAG
jgi:hypothetical protein